ncbi:MAG: hypothetical protein SPD90_13900 [Intestinibacter sp.]|uniref:hypothetical protein n=1 Tax=Intestinibacter sp. TaxID=1965304 RepID=UPI002A83A2A6|nr:hypothetical protein [Intestinibacter sp.]MDY4576138.1 hypothetical protein [Intestinibacter sp.]
MNYKSKKVMILIILVLLIIIPAGIFINKNLSKGDLDSNTVKWTQEKNSDPESIKIPGYSTITIPADTKNVKITLGNPEGNQCYFKFELLVDGESLYTSDFVQAGYAIENVELQKGLKKGTYDAVIKITPYSLNKETQYAGANVRATMEVV